MIGDEKRRISEGNRDGADSRCDGDRLVDHRLYRFFFALHVQLLSSGESRLGCFGYYLVRRVQQPVESERRCMREVVRERIRQHRCSTGANR